MRRTLAISLLILFSLPLTLPFFSVNASAASVPMCCRKNGKHHCVMSLNSSQSKTTMVGDPCPYRVAPPAILVLPSFTPSPSAAIYAGVVRQPAATTQEEARQRVSFDRSRQKRAPPARVA